jgi:hypothetical protein
MTRVRCNPFSIRKVNEAQWRDNETFTLMLSIVSDEGDLSVDIRSYILDEYVLYCCCRSDKVNE